jgi:hypothetical protein
MGDCPQHLDVRTVVNAFLPSVQSPILRRTVTYWLEKCGNRRMPRRKDIEPLDLREALGFISLIEIHHDPLRFFFRLDGTKQVELFQIDCTGRYLHECFGEEHLSVAQKSYQTATQTGCPSYFQRKLTYRERLISYEIAILPLGDTPSGPLDEDVGNSVLEGSLQPNMLMTVIVPDWQEAI